MKFGEYLRNNLTSEWSSQYIEYDDMKELFSDIIAKAPLIDATNQNLLRKQHFLLADQEYFLVRRYYFS
jgi:SPX domain protein involved in polyphosphate accumulation